jgi:hypothetical protein
MLTESQGCQVLQRVFAERGYHVQADVPFREGGVSFDADGWDPVARVGFEYLTSEAGDREDLDAAEMAELDARMGRGELFFFIMDGGLVSTAEDLAWAAHHFLDEVARRRGAP